MLHKKHNKVPVDFLRFLLHLSLQHQQVTHDCSDDTELVVVLLSYSKNTVELGLVSLRYKQLDTKALCVCVFPQCTHLTASARQRKVE